MVLELYERLSQALEDAELTYNNLDNNRKKMVKFISVKEFC